MKKVIITGCNGFIGNHCMEFYKELGYDVYGIDIKISDEQKRNNKYIECNLSQDDMTGIYSLINPDIFIHCAGNASVGKSIEYPEMDFEGNVSVLYKTLSALVRGNLNPKFIFLSSAAVYGNVKELPITEEHETNPISPYGLHKKICEDICKYYREQKNMNISVVRIFSAYGVGLRKQILWDMYNKYEKNNEIKLFGTGMETRDFININDVVSSIYLLSNLKDSEFIYNVANGEETKIKDLALEFAEAIGLEGDKVSFTGNIKLGDPINWRADISKIKEVGYKKGVSLKDGINEYVQWAKGLGDE